MAATFKAFSALLSYPDPDLQSAVGEIADVISSEGLIDVAAMLHAIFGEAAPGDDFSAALHDLTEGNPFFVEEVLKALVVAGDLAPAADGRWRARRLERLHVPRSAILPEADWLSEDAPTGWPRQVEELYLRNTRLFEALMPLKMLHLNALRVVAEAMAR